MRSCHSLWELLPSLRRGTVCLCWTPILCRCEGCCENTSQSEKLDFSLIESQNVWDYRWRNVLLPCHLCLQRTSLLDLLFPGAPLLEMSSPPEREEEQIKLLNGPRPCLPERGTGKPVQGGKQRRGGFVRAKWLLWIPPLAKVDPWKDAWGALEPGGIAASAISLQSHTLGLLSGDLDVCIYCVGRWRIKYQRQLKTNGISWPNITMHQLHSNSELAEAAWALTHSVLLKL